MSRLPDTLTRIGWGAGFHIQALREGLQRRVPAGMLATAQRLYHRWRRPAHSAWRRTRAADLPYGEVATIDGIRIRVHPSLSIKNAWRIVSGVHTRSERRLALSVLAPEDVVMELGGGIGMLSTACALRIGSERVFAFEANPALAPLIEENYRLNGVAPEMNLCLLGAEPGVRDFHVSSDFSDSSLFRDTTSRYARTVRVPVRPINAELARIRPTLLIVDIEGAEVELLPMADLARVRKLIVELHPGCTGAWRANALRRRLRRQGFVETDKAGNCILFKRAGEGVARAGSGCGPGERPG